MKIILKKSNLTLLHATFAIWLLGEFVFPYTVISRFVLLLFVGVVILVTHRLRWSHILTGYLLFALWSALNIATGHAVSNSTAKEMTETLFLNAAFLYAFLCYCKYVGSATKVLSFFKTVMLIFAVCCLAVGFGVVLRGERLRILEMNSNVIAMMVAYASVVQLYLLQSKEKPNRTWRDYASFCVLLLTALLTASRKGLIIPIVGFYVLFCFRRPKKFVKYSLITIVIVTVAVNLLLHVDFLYETVGFRVKPVLDYLQGEQIEEASLSSRVDYIELGWEASKNSPIWGHGLDCFRLLRQAHNTYSHNNYIEILYSLGWVGVALYYSPYIYTLFKIPRVLREKKQGISLALALFAAYVICDYANVTYFTRILLIIPMMAMLLLGEKEVRNEN